MEQKTFILALTALVVWQMFRIRKIQGMVFNNAKLLADMVQDMPQYQEGG